MNEPIVVVTGASSGIGEGLALALAARGHRVLLVARRRERLETLARAIGGGASIWTGDLREPAAADELLDHVAAQGWVLEGLVNNAGLGSQLSLAKMPEENMEAMLQVNVASLVRLTRRVLPGMIERRSGFILNMASMAGFQPMPYFAVYAASKAFVLSFSEAVHEEARPHGVHVGALCPGPVSTEFQKIAGMNPRFFARSQSVDEVVRVAMRQLDRRKAVVCTSLSLKFAAGAVQMLPRSWVRWLVGCLLRGSGAS